MTMPLIATALFLALFVQLNYLQVVKADSLANDPRNVRAVKRAFSRSTSAAVPSTDGLFVRP